MINPLTLEEKVSVTRIIDHDIMEHLVNLTEMAYGEKENKNAYFESRHIHEMLSCISMLSKYDENCYFDIINNKIIERRLEQLQAVSEHPEKIDYQIMMDGKFMTHPNLLYSVLHNLSKNSLRLIPKENGKININISEYYGAIRNPIYQNPETKRSGGFIKINVNDNGKGFPSDIPFDNWLKLGESGTGGSGFGLYYTTLVCKFLRSHLEITSKPGDTNITIYHPLTLNNN